MQTSLDVLIQSVMVAERVSSIWVNPPVLPSRIFSHSYHDLIDTAASGGLPVERAANPGPGSLRTSVERLVGAKTAQGFLAAPLLGSTWLGAAGRFPVRLADHALRGQPDHSVLARKFGPAVDLVFSGRWLFRQPVVEQLLQLNRSFSDPAEPPTREVHREPATENPGKWRRHARQNGIADPSNVERNRWLQNPLHSEHGRAVPSSDVGARTRAQKSHSAHLFRHDGLRTAPSWQLQAGRVGTHRQARRPGRWEPGRRRLQRTLQHHVSPYDPLTSVNWSQTSVAICCGMPSCHLEGNSWDPCKYEC